MLVPTRTVDYWGCDVSGRPLLRNIFSGVVGIGISLVFFQLHAEIKRIRTTMGSAGQFEKSKMYNQVQCLIFVQKGSLRYSVGLKYPIFKYI